MTPIRSQGCAWRDCTGSRTTPASFEAGRVSPSSDVPKPGRSGSRPRWSPSPMRGRPRPAIAHSERGWRRKPCGWPSRANADGLPGLVCDSRPRTMRDELLRRPPRRSRCQLRTHPETSGTQDRPFAMRAGERSVVASCTRPGEKASLLPSSAHGMTASCTQDDTGQDPATVGVGCGRSFIGRRSQRSRDGTKIYENNRIHIKNSGRRMRSEKSDAPRR
jgi:hypothetical protein